MSLEGFYQIKWQRSIITSCDVDYWSVERYGIGGGAPGVCSMATAAGMQRPAALGPGSPLNLGLWTADLTTTTANPFGGPKDGLINGEAVPVLSYPDAKDGGQWGVAFRFPVEAIDTEFGVYAMNIHSRTPILSGRISAVPNPLPPATTTAVVGSQAIASGAGAQIYAALGGTGGYATVAAAANNASLPAQVRAGAQQVVAAVNTNVATLQRTAGNLLGAYGNVLGIAAIMEYPEDIAVYGLSAATTLAGWSVGAEFSYTPKQPVQISGADLLFAGAGLGPNAGTYNALRAQSVASGGAKIYYKGYDEFHKSTFQINALNSLPKLVTNAIGATAGLFVAEAGFQWLDVPDTINALSMSAATADTLNRRYGRGFAYGLPETNAACAVASPPASCTVSNISGSKVDGYVTDFAWGYRLRVSADYSQVFGSGWTMTPSVFWAHDVDGTSHDGQFQEDRKTLGLGLAFNLNKVHNLAFTFTTFDDKAEYNVFRDRDNYSIAYSYTF